MNTLSARPLARNLGALLLGIAVAGAPALSYADHNFSGGGHSGGDHSGGGHSGGGHSGGGGGGHFSGGGHSFGGGGGHFVGGGHFGGYGGGHYAGGYYGGGHAVSHGGGFAGGYAAGGAHYYSGARGYAGVRAGAGFASGRFAAGRVFYPGRGFYPGRYWAGGYWHGAFWPHCYFYPGFAWFLPYLPFGYATFWWGGVPYYYVNDLYYTYSPADSGYVVSEPPPAAGEGEAGSADAPAVPSSDIYLYPRNGQSDQQMANDRYECHSWAVGQTGFDPTRGGQQSGNRDDYRRAMISCLDARGYSAR